MATLRIVADHRVSGGSTVLGSSARMQELLAQVELLAANDRTVLIYGERGTGKGRVASLIHAHSRRATHPFVDVSVAGDAGALDRDLFGEEALPDGVTRSGLVEAADGGTLFLDDVASLTPELQLKLLGLVEDQRFRRAGGTADISANVRTVMATSRDLVHEVNEARLREDLHYRISLMPLYLPPLRACGRDELIELIEQSLAELAVQLPDAPRAVTDEAIDRLVKYPWPGNLRELRNVLERAMIVGRTTDGGRIDVAHLPAELRQTAAPMPEPFEVRTLQELERRQIARTLVAFDSNRTHAARALGISRATLIKKIRTYGLGRASR